MDQNKVPVVVERLLYSAVEAGRQQVIVMTEEDTRGGYRVYAKIMLSSFPIIPFKIP